jgi:hypothetical protein
LRRRPPAERARRDRAERDRARQQDRFAPSFHDGAGLFRRNAYTIGLHFHRTSGKNTYNDGYVDKISARLRMAGSTPPAPDCTAPKSRPGDPPRKPTPSDPDDGTNTAAPITRGSKRVTFGKRYATFRLHCVAHDTACKGRATLKTKASRVGSSRSSSVRRWRARVAHLSVRRFARLKLTAVMKIGREKTSFGFGAIR